MEPVRAIEENREIKFFVGGVTHDTNEQTLREYFGKYGDVKTTQIIRFRETGVSKGFGFIEFNENSAAIGQVLQDKHVILGKTVEVKEAKPRGPWRAETSNPCKNKIFVGGIPNDLTIEELKAHFERYGTVIGVEVRPSRGFAFVTFASGEAVKSTLQTRFQNLKAKQVEVKVAEDRHTMKAHQYPVWSSPLIPNNEIYYLPIYYPSEFMVGYYPTSNMGVSHQVQHLSTTSVTFPLPMNNPQPRSASAITIREPTDKMQCKSSSVSIRAPVENVEIENDRGETDK